jgi:hypothetical protein
VIERHRLSPIIHKKDRAGASWYFVRCTCGYRSLHSDLKMAGAAEQKHMDEVFDR